MQIRVPEKKIKRVPEYPCMTAANVTVLLLKMKSSIS
jgi:hypothetical protein